MRFTLLLVIFVASAVYFLNIKILGLGLEKTLHQMRDNFLVMMEITEKSRFFFHASKRQNALSARADLDGDAQHCIWQNYGHIDKNGALSVNLDEILDELVEQHCIKKCRTKSVANRQHCSTFHLIQDRNGTFFRPL